MRKTRTVFSLLVGTGFLLGLVSLPGCGDPEAGSAPKLKGSKDEVQDAMYGGTAKKGAPTGTKRKAG